MSKFRNGDKVIANADYNRMGVQKGDKGVVVCTFPLEVEITNNVTITFHDHLFGEQLYDFDPATPIYYGQVSYALDNLEIFQPAHVCKEFKEYVGLGVFESAYFYCIDCDKRKK